MSTEPELLLTKKMIAKAFGVTARAVSEWDIEPAGKRGRAHVYYLPDVLDYKLRALEANASASYELTEERARLTHHQANIAEMDEAVKRDQLFDGREVLKLCSSAHAAAKNRVLGIHSKIASQFPDLDHEVTEEIQNECTNALNEIGKAGIPKGIEHRLAKAIKYLDGKEKAPTT